MSKLRRKVTYTWPWRIRYWWLDTQSGAQARVAAISICAIVFLAQFIRGLVIVVTPHQPHQAIIWVVVWLIVALVVGLFLAASANSKPAQPPDQGAKAPTTQDGRSASRFYGTCCITDPAQLAWKVVGKDPIQQSSGK